MLARAAPRSILTGRPLPVGLSGGVTLAGTAAEVLGAAFIALCAGPPSAVAVALGGVAGAFVDSLLGAALQARRWCAACARECENDPHACGNPTVHLRGLPWLHNDGVNFAATATGALVALGTASLGRGFH